MRTEHQRVIRLFLERGVGGLSNALTFLSVLPPLALIEWKGEHRMRSEEEERLRQWKGTRELKVLLIADGFKWKVDQDKLVLFSKKEDEQLKNPRMTRSVLNQIKKQTVQTYIIYIKQVSEANKKEMETR